LHCAAQNGDEETITTLLAAGADVNACDGQQRTPLHGAIQPDEHYGMETRVETLLAAGADVNARDSAGLTPLDTAIACKQKKIAELLRAKGAKTGKELDGAPPP
jgi:ankyrin repeat protein